MSNNYWKQNGGTRADQLREYKSAQEMYERRLRMPSEISDNMAKSVSDQRRSILEQEVDSGLFREKGAMPEFVSGRFNFKTGSFEPTGFDSSNNQPDMTQSTQAGVVTGEGRSEISKVANFGSSSQLGVGASSVGSGWRGPGDTARQIPEVYSPLWLNSNLNLPRDRATINSWSRSFFALNPIVQNAISLHSTYPISKLNIKSKNKKVEKFFSDMIEEIDLMNICVQIAQEYWTLGEAFVYAELDQSKGKWKRLLIQNPDYITVRRTALAGDPVMSLRPDQNLVRIVNSNHPADIQQRKQLSPEVVEYIKKNQNIPLNNFNVSHLARKISPYEVRGTGLIVSCFKSLMLFDKLRECHSEDTEFLTKDGWKTIDQVMEVSTEPNPNPDYVNGVQIDDDGQVQGVFKLKDNVEIACFNPDSDKLEYHVPDELHMSQYDGEMYHFHGEKIDCLVSPNHKMWTKRKNTEWSKTPVSEMLKKKDYWTFRSGAEFKGKKIKSINILNKKIDIKDYLKFLGYFVSEGCVYKEESHYDNKLSISQLTSSDCYDDMRSSFEKIACFFGGNVSTNVSLKGSGYSKHCPKEKWEASFSNKGFVNYLLDEIGDGSSAKSNVKRLPRWVFELDSSLLKILLDALVKGDGSENTKLSGSTAYKYSTISKTLSDDVYELAYKCGYVPNVCISDAIKSDGRKVKEYIVLWSDTNYGKEPKVRTFDLSAKNNGGGAVVEKVDYNGVVWCFTVPTGLFVTRRNGKVTIQGNSKYAQADNMVNPLTLVKVGSDDFRPTPVDLDNWREVFECYDDDTEVLTDCGFKSFKDVISYKPTAALLSNKKASYMYDAKPVDGLKVACFNPNTEHIEYHDPIHASVYDYSGEMVNFSARNMDINVTPNHDMWLKNRDNDWSKVKAGEIKEKSNSRTRAIAKFSGDKPEFVDVLGKQIPTELYLKFLGYLISEGSVESRSYKYSTINEICITQSVNSDCIDDINDTVNKFASYFNDTPYVRTRTPSGDIYKKQPSDVTHFHLRSKDLVLFFKNEISSGEICNSHTKAVPNWVMNLDCSLLHVFLETLVLGDGSSLKNKNSNAFKYYTSSKKLADNVQEIAFKCGYSSNISTRIRDKKYKCKEKYGDLYKSTEYVVSWSDAADGMYPAVCGNIQRKEYDGKVWCFTVPHGLFVTRRNGKITIQGNSAQYDKDFKIFTHNAVNVERVGYGQGIYDIGNDIQQSIKEIYIGLMVPSVLMDGTDTTYANGSVALDVLRQRYMQFRNMLSAWLKNKIFAPISKIQGFYDYSGGSKQLIVPEIDWNHMSLFDMDSHINHLMQLAQGQPGQPGTNSVSIQTLYRSLGLEYEDETRKMRYEDIQEQIRAKENESLTHYSLSELRALTPDDEIAEAVEPPLPGESPYVEPSAGDMTGMPGGAPGGAPGGMPPIPGGGGGGGLPPIGKPPRPPQGAGGAPPKGPGGAPKLPGGPQGGGSPQGPTGGGTPPNNPPPPS